MKPVILQKDFAAGMRRKQSRDQIPGNGVYTLKDWIPDRLGSPLEKRGGWNYAGSVASGTPVAIRQIVDAPFNGGHYVLAVDAAGNVYRGDANAGVPASWAVDATTETVENGLQNPYFFLDNLLFPAATTGGSCFQANENTVTPFSVGSYPLVYIASWKGRLVGASGERIVMGPAGDPTSQAWDDAATYLRSQPIRGLRELRNSLLVFYDGFTERLRGNYPAGYGVSNDDIVIEMLFSDVGLVDAFSIVEWNDQLIWADRKGVYLSDGAGVIDLTDQGEMKDFWAQSLAGYSKEFHRVACGIHRDLLIVSVVDFDSHDEVITLVCDLPRRAWFQWTNCPFTCFAMDRKGPNTTYAGIETVDGRVVDLSSVFDPSNNPSDADGSNVLPQIEFPYYRLGASEQRLVDLYVAYQLGVSDALNPPSLTVTYAKEPDGDPTYASAANGTGTLEAEDQYGTSDEGYHYKRVAIRDRTEGASVKIVQTNPSSTTRLYSLSATFIPLSGFKDS